jgi:hypothetical protein
MRGKRERIFDCGFSCTTGESRIVVRAWTPTEAAQTLEEALARAGMLAPGEITVRDSRGRVALCVATAGPPGAELAGVA